MRMTLRGIQINMEENKIRPVYVLRTPQMLGRYRKHLKTNSGNIAFFLTNPSICEWKHWRLIKNDFPYDVLAKKHHILTPKRVFSEEVEMSGGERKELIRIKQELNDSYDTVFENFIHQRSFKNHYHLHLIRYRDDAVFVDK